MRSTIAAFILGVVASLSVAAVARADVYGSVAGSVIGPMNQPVAHARVTLTAPDTEVLRAETDNAGRFVFARVAFDTYTITVDTDEFDRASDIVTVSSGDVARVTFHLTAKTIGRVVTRASSVGASGQPVSISVLSARTIQTLPTNSSLAKVVETAPGIVPFSYGEPVSRGFHGIAYEIDGVPVPQTAGQYFSEIVDPRTISRLEVFTGAFPAEFGGQRQGGVVDILTRRATDVQGGSQGTLSLYGGSFGTEGISFNQAAGGGGLRAFVGGNIFRNNRGLDAPTAAALHDDSNQYDGFGRLQFSDARDTFAFDYALQYAAFQIPINTNQNDPNDPNWYVPGTDDNQKEYARFANLTWSRLSGDGRGYFEISPWWSSGRIQYLADPARDLAGASQSSVNQDRSSNFLGLSTLLERSAGAHNVKIGVQTSVENAASRFSLLFIDPATGLLAPPFTDNVAQRGSSLGAYIEDKYELTSFVTVNAGLRYDHSSGFVSGHQLSPRLEVNLQADPRDVVHLYYGRLYAAPSLEDVRRSAVVIGGGSPNALPVYDLKPERDSIYEGGVAHTFTPQINGSINLWARSVQNVLDTTQVGATPLFTLFNSAQGQAMGAELRLQGRTASGNNYFLSYGASLSQAKGISGGTFLFPIDQLQGANSWALEDHDQTNTINAAYTFSLSPSGRFATLQTVYGSGFPVQFENGSGRLPVHWEINASYGQPAGHGVGWEIDGTNLLDHAYLIKVANGFNSTQYAQGRSITLKLTSAIP